MKDLESERRVISCLMTADADEPILAAMQQLSRADFTEALHQRMFESISALYSRGVKPTYVEVLKDIKPSSVVEVDELTFIAEQFISSRNITYWIDNVRESSKRRGLFKTAGYIQAALEDKEPADDILDVLSEKITDMSMNNHTEVIAGEQLAREGISYVEDRVEQFKQAKAQGFKSAPLDGVPTGFPKLDKNTFGYKAGDLIIVGAETGKGKTALAIHTAATVAVQAGEPVLYINTEMSRKQIMLRLGSVLSGERSSDIRVGSLDSEQIINVFDGYEKLGPSPFFLITDANLSVRSLERYANQLKIQKGIKLLIVDYVGRMDKIQRDTTEWQRLEQIIKAQKMIAQKLDIAVMCLVQLNDDGNLQGARRMKNECDLMLKLLPLEMNEFGRPKDKPYQDYPTANYTLVIDKNRDNATGEVPIVFDLPTQRFSEAENVNGEWASMGKVVR